jgi:hypothetical protein
MIVKNPADPSSVPASVELDGVNVAPDVEK